MAHNNLIQCTVTCSLYKFDGCFQAYYLIVLVIILTFNTWYFLMTLISILDCFPLDLEPYRTKSDFRIYTIFIF